MTLGEGKVENSLELIFIYDMEYRSNFILFPYEYPIIILSPFIKKAVLPAFSRTSH